jgi:hypothetical protein
MQENLTMVRGRHTFKTGYMLQGREMAMQFPQTGIERMTFWLTAERHRRSHRCKATSKKARHGRSRAGEWD